LSIGSVAVVPVTVPDVLVEFVAVEEESLAVAVGGDRSSTGAGAESFGAEAQVAGGFQRRHPRVGLLDGDGGELALDQIAYETLDLGSEQVEKRRGERVAHAAHPA
jgi:hypothetical protein